MKTRNQATRHRRSFSPRAIGTTNRCQGCSRLSVGDGDGDIGKLPQGRWGNENRLCRGSAPFPRLRRSSGRYPPSGVSPPNTPRWLVWGRGRPRVAGPLAGTGRTTGPTCANVGQRDRDGRKVQGDQVPGVKRVLGDAADTSAGTGGRAGRWCHLPYHDLPYQLLRAVPAPYRLKLSSRTKAPYRGHWYRCQLRRRYRMVRLLWYGWYG